jgi:hypothetical protein
VLSVSPVVPHVPSHQLALRRSCVAGVVSPVVSLTCAQTAMERSLRLLESMLLDQRTRQRVVHFKVGGLQEQRVPAPHISARLGFPSTKAESENKATHPAQPKRRYYSKH